MEQPTVRFETPVEVVGNETPWHVLRVRRSQVAILGLKGNLRRVVCTLNALEPFNCSLFPSKGDYFLTLSKPLRAKLGVDVGDVVNVMLVKDESKYGMPMPEEFAEVLRQDPEAEQLFESLSPGNQRLMLKLIVMVRDVDKRILRALAGAELLKSSGGVFDYHAQHLAMRTASTMPEFRPDDLG